MASSEFSITLRNYAGVPVLDLAGEINKNTLGTVEEMVERLVSAGHYHVMIDLRDDIAGDSSDYKVRPCAREKDFRALMKVHESFNRHRAFTTIRTPEYWRDYVMPRFGAEEDTLVAERDGSVVGYLYAKTQVDRRILQVQETGCLSGCEGCLDSLLRAAAPQAMAKGVTTLELLPPEEPTLLQAIRNNVKSLEFREYFGAMCMVTNMRSLARKLLPELQIRAKKSGAPSGSVSLDTEMGRLVLSVTDGEVSLGGERPTRVPIDHAAHRRGDQGQAALASHDRDGAENRPDPDSGDIRVDHVPRSVTRSHE